MDILLSPKHGLNPTIPICFWCGEEKNEIALMGRIGDARKGEDFEAPMHAVLDYEPCDKCREKNVHWVYHDRSHPRSEPHNKSTDAAGRLSNRPICGHQKRGGDAVVHASNRPKQR